MPGARSARTYSAFFFAAYVLLCFSIGEVFPFSHYGMFSGRYPYFAMIVPRADGHPVDLVDLVRFSGNAPPLDSRQLKEHLERRGLFLNQRGPPQIDFLYSYILHHSAARPHAISASQAFLVFETCMGRNISPWEELWWYLRWLGEPPAPSPRVSQVEIASEGIYYDPELRTFGRDRVLLWKGTAHRLR